MIFRKISLSLWSYSFVSSLFCLKVSMFSFKTLYLLSVSSIIFLINSMLLFSYFIWLLHEKSVTFLLPCSRYFHTWAYTSDVRRWTFEISSKSIDTSFEWIRAGDGRLFTKALETSLDIIEFCLTIWSISRGFRWAYIFLLPSNIIMKEE